MKTASYPQIGSKVSFVRQGADGQPVEGTGLIIAVVLDPAKRLMVHLETEELNEHGGKVRHNVHLNCLEPSDEFKASFKASLDAIAAIGEEGNGKSREIVAEYNQRVDAAYSEVLGAAVVFDE